ncbi:hypothetical protein UFOVP610_41 [uncultured Caudovirales phage]|uniref:Uncharacterized protein n=1 Tax=uncultured Caudovirales phage TaxID=2100421 RepID=A0A6J5N1S2_9CAUD|nr:hypothetical protein UFOVP610_41 [uncultured Caudovirales phage]
MIPQLKAKLEDLMMAFCYEYIKTMNPLNVEVTKIDFINGFKCGSQIAQKEAEGLLKFVKSFDQYFAERIIDDCGFDPEKESKEDLIKLVKTLSEDNKLNLTNLRCWISKYESGE